jgi:hypothetical protein
MLKYWHVINIGIQNNLTYRFNFLARALFRSWDPESNAKIDAAAVEATTVALVYYPCAD